jgi:hypothetical protein
MRAKKRSSPPSRARHVSTPQGKGPPLVHRRRSRRALQIAALRAFDNAIENADAVAEEVHDDLAAGRTRDEFPKKLQDANRKVNALAVRCWTLGTREPRPRQLALPVAQL